MTIKEWACKMKNVQGGSAFIQRSRLCQPLHIAALSIFLLCPASSGCGSELKTCSYTFVWMSEVSCMMYCCTLGRWWQPAPVMLNHPILRSNGSAFSVVDFASQQHNPCQGIHHTLLLCSSACLAPCCQCPWALGAAGCLSLPHLPMERQTCLPARLLQAGDFSAVPVCGLQERGKALSWKLAGAGTAGWEK